ncbi:MAG: HAD family hydrolase [Elusimicrobiota bacterium]|jgi:phosphoglycolate phosphatase-like HAD superfamily hydrolase
MIKKLLLFDLDWTLVYTGGAGVRALNHAFEKLFQIPNAMKIVSPDGKTDPAICREMMRVHLNRSPQNGEIEALCRGYLDQLKVEVPQSPGYLILPGIPALLRALSDRSDVLLGLGTGNLEEGAHIKLDRADLMRYFRFGGYGSDAENRPELLRMASKRGQKLAGHSLPPTDIIVIGDNIRDVQAGKAIGARTVAVATGPMSSEDLAAAQPDHLFPDLSETDKVIKILMDLA